MLGPPIRPNLSLGDSVAGLHAAFGTVRVHNFIVLHARGIETYPQVLALLARKNREAQGQPGGQTVDVSIFERYLHLF